MRNFWMTIAGISLVAGIAHADAPAYLPVQGILVDSDGTAVDGDTDLTFTFYVSDLATDSLWTETQTVLVADGFFTAYLGDVTTLDLALFRDNGTIWMGVTVGTDEEMDRFQIATTGFAAFAQYAGDAATLGGHDATWFATSGGDVDWTTLTNVPADLSDGDADTLGVIECTDGQIVTWSGTGWVCGNDTGFTSEVELTALLDDNYLAATYTPDWSVLTGIPSDLADGDDDTTYTAGDGLILTGTAFSVDFAGTGSAITAARSDHTQAWTTLTAVPAGFADGVDDTIEVDGVDYAGGDQSLNITSTDAVVRSVTIDLPQAGHVVLAASASVEFTGAGRDFVRCSITTGTGLDYDHLNTVEDYGSTATVDTVSQISAVRGYSPGAGSATYRFVCDTPYGSARIRDSNLTAVFSSNRY